jgi:sulfite exporter TauE/SafE
MCGPLALAGCTRAGRVHARGAAGYFLGRAAAYTFAGALFGSLGAHAEHWLPLGTLQPALLFIVAVCALAKGLRLLLVRWRRPGLPLAVVPLRRPSLLQRVWAPIRPQRALALGLVTGALPCGLLAGGWALAAASASPLVGAAVMAVFSLATLPALSASLIATRIRLSPTSAGVLWCALALWIGVRPLFGHVAHLHAGH